MTATDITRALATKHWNYVKQIIVPRCYFAGDEADILILNSSNWLEEVEIKISEVDFKREFASKKKKHKKLVYGSTIKKQLIPHMIHKFWFAMPKELADKLVNDIPEYAGLIYIDKIKKKFYIVILKNSPELKMSRKLSDIERMKLMRLAYLRFWNKENLRLMDL